MNVLQPSDLKPGRRVWLEDYGLAFKKLRMSKVTVLLATREYMLFFPFRRLPMATYNRDMTWRCWDERPDADAVCETEWTGAVLQAVFPIMGSLYGLASCARFSSWC